MASSILAELERDMAPECAAAFVALATDYFAATRDASGPVSTPHSPAALGARFAEPLPRGGQPAAASSSGWRATSSATATDSTTRCTSGTR